MRFESHEIMMMRLMEKLHDSIQDRKREEESHGMLIAMMRRRIQQTERLFQPVFLSVDYVRQPDPSGTAKNMVMMMMKEKKKKQ